MIRSSSATVVALALGLAVSGCAMGGAGDGSAPLTPLSRYSLQVEPGVDRIALAVHDSGLSANQRAALAELAGRYSTSGSGAIRVEAPAGDDPVSSSQAYAVRAALQAAGVPAERIQVAAYSAPDPRAPVLAGFETVRARIPNCALEPRDLGRRFSNQSSTGFGCAVTANMAAQIADPRDILGARAMTPADSGRAAVVFDRYRRGQASSTPQEELVQGQVSSAVE
ncbi:CpaD family pilus assembly protein [Brevundimonas sp.]|uniref:CpaD family pilus assembly protein n=1 Tax=Brevundimonas sp. TaxID=1871086 RepID=UPI002BBDA342|nr:CpaD family pilus assembly protein [Brevundimonas sp.]HWQ87234.1 CpaD family pilus assembly protein [Brevundimonas sp.]